MTPLNNQEKELISIIMPVYKTLAYLPRALDSVLAQSYDHFELIIVDDGSPDESGKLCDDYAGKDNRIRVIHQENAGLSAARNTGIQAARGSWLAFLDSDDALEPSYLQELYDSAAAAGTDAAVCGWIYEYEDGTPSRECLPTPGVFTAKEILPGLSLPGGVIFVTAWNKLTRKRLWEGLSFPVSKLHEDEFVAHELLFRAGRIAVLDKALYIYRQRSGSITNISRDIRHWDGAEALIRRYHYLKDKNMDEILPEVFKGFISQYITCLRDQNIKLPAEAERLSEIRRLAMPMWQRENDHASRSESLAFNHPRLWKSLFYMKQGLKRG